MAARLVPRVILIRHGETEWALNGRHTGRTDIPLTQNGEKKIIQHAPEIVGEEKLIDQKNICKIYVSPRQRARRTFELLFSPLKELPKYEINEQVREWDYGDYEGLTPAEIKQRDKHFNIWRTGCPGGESADEMSRRVDRVIEEVQELHRQYVQKNVGKRDIIIVAHGHFSRVFVARWIQFPICLGTHFTFDPAGIAILSYNHQSLNEPALNALNLHADHIN